MPHCSVMPDCCVTVSLLLRDVPRGHPISPVRLCEGEHVCPLRKMTERFRPFPEEGFSSGQARGEAAVPGVPTPSRQRCPRVRRESQRSEDGRWTDRCQRACREELVPGEFLIALCRHSDHALETVLLMSGREEQVKRRSSLTRRRNFGRCDADGRTAGQIDPGRVRAYVANRSPAFSNSCSLTRL